MEGEKIEQAKRSAVQLVRDMRDDDEIAFVRYDSGSELVQSLARVGNVRSALIAKIDALRAGGGTNIPGGSRRVSARSPRPATVACVASCSRATGSTRRARRPKRSRRGAAERGVTVSSMGIGLDFDEQYMGGVARAGHGNFAFVKDGGSARDASSIASSTRRPRTTIDTATAKLVIPAHFRFVRAIGADAHPNADGTEVALSMGSLFAGDERRVVIELATDLQTGETRGHRRRRELDARRRRRGRSAPRASRRRGHDRSPRGRAEPRRGRASRTR